MNSYMGGYGGSNVYNGYGGFGMSNVNIQNNQQMDSGAFTNVYGIIGNKLNLLLKNKYFCFY